MICKHCKQEIVKCEHCQPCTFTGYHHIHSDSHWCDGDRSLAELEIIEETKEINFKELCENTADRVVDIIVDIYGSAGKDMFKQAVIFILKEELDKMTLSV